MDATHNPQRCYNEVYQEVAVYKKVEAQRKAGAPPQRKETRKLAAYIPEIDAPLKLICANLHVFQDQNGQQHYKSAEMWRIKRILDWINDRFAHPHAPTHPVVPAAPLLPDTRIRFRLHRVEFYQDRKLHALDDIVPLQDAAVQRNPGTLNNLNIYFIYTTGLGGGHAPFPSDTNFGFDSYVIYRIPYESDPTKIDNADWGVSMLLGHELGHSLGLSHTYLGANCNTASADFLWDVFGNPSTCPHNANWSANLSAPWPPKYSNNLLGGTNDCSWISALQGAMMQRALTEKSVRRYLALDGDCGHVFGVRR